MTIEEALLEIGLFRDTVQPPPDTAMYIALGLLPDTCDHGVPHLHPCIQCKAGRAEAA